MAKIYVVTKGCYSDYRIITATLDEEEAKKIAEKFTTDLEDAIVEVYEDSDAYLKRLWYVEFDFNDDIFSIENRDNSEYAYSRLGYIGRLAGGRVVAYVTADTPEEATKIASEKYAQFKAKERGLI